MTTLVLLPGMDGTGAMFRDLLGCLPPTLRPVVVSYPPDRPWGYVELVSYVTRALPAGEPYILLAESFSGPVAIRLAAERPPALRGLVLCCTFVRAPVLAARLPQHLLLALGAVARFPVLASPLLFGRSMRPGLMRALHGCLRSVDPAVLRARLRAVADVDMTRQAHDINVPALYLQAENDWIVAPSAARNLAHCLPHLLLRRIQGPHLLLQARPRQSADMIAEFAASLQAVT